MTLVYPDACVIIAAGDAAQPLHELALKRLTGTSTRLAGSQLLVIETVSAATRKGLHHQADFARAVLNRCDHWVALDESLFHEVADTLSRPMGLRLQDAIHVIAARRAGAALMNLDAALIRLDRKLGVRILSLE